jgi:phosphinothricin acetyltransferase
MVSIRLANSGDAAQVAAIYAPSCTETAVSFENVAPTPAEMGERIARVTAQYPWLVLDCEGEIAGYAYAGPHRERAAYRWSVDVAVYVAAGQRRTGVGRALYAALFRVLVLQGYFKVYAGATLPNPGSEGLHEAVGFEPVGTYRRVGYKLGAWHDVRWYQRALQPERDDPPEPVGVRALLDTAEWAEAMAAGLALWRGGRAG